MTALALAAAAGDRDALADLIRATQGDVWRFVAYLAGREHADDLTQETFLRMLPALPTFAGRSSALTWLLAIARRAAADRVRHERARPHHALLADPDVDRPDPRTGASVELDAVLATLDPDRRAALVLTQVWGFSYVEASEILGCPVGTVRSRVSRARGDLQAALAASVVG